MTKEKLRLLMKEARERNVGSRAVHRSSRGIADYNRGCVYAALGRAEEAIPWLRSGFELKPVLREVAEDDPDLDPIRTTPELVALLTQP